MIVALIIFAVVIVLIVAHGHGMAVEASEFAMRQRLNAEAPGSDATRKLLREAGYRV